jgi:hypothetical protein
MLSWSERSLEACFGDGRVLLRIATDVFRCKTNLAGPAVGPSRRSFPWTRRHNVKSDKQLLLKN